MTHYRKYDFQLFTRLSLLILFFASSQSFALSTIEKLQQQAENKKLYEKPYWLALGHYNTVGTANNKFESYTDDPGFFLSENGKYSPEDELKATLSAFFDRDKTGNEHAQCRFVARLNWIISELSADRSKLPQQNCAEYQVWRNAINAETVTLIFASHFVNSPSSMYGHTLLRIDPPKRVNPSQWLSYAVNFGANVREDENSLFYAWRGLTGGYPGLFAMEPYYKKIKQYSNLENRGLWEYQLDLTPEEVNKLVVHLWELKGISFDYFFTDENCSFRLLELLEIARPNINLLSTFAYKAIPTDTVRVVSDHGMIKNINYRASHIEKINYIASSLNPEQKILAHDLSIDTGLAEGEEYKSTSLDDKQNILYVAYNYLRYKQTKTARDKDIAKRSHRLLVEINEHGNADLSSLPRPFNPIEGHKTMSLIVAAGNEGSEEFIEGQWRMTYHDLLDPGPGYPLGLGIEMFGVTARQWQSGRSTLERLDFVEINSFAARDILFKPSSWRVNGGLERIYSDDGDQLAPHITGGRGYSVELNDDLLYYTLITGRYEYNEMHNGNHQVGAGISLGIIGEIHNVNTTLDLTTYKLLNGEERYSMTFGLSYEFAKNKAIRLTAEGVKEGVYQENNIKLGYRHYF
ncbi:MAG: DUF4105 domain-containing protein [Candidatus Reddybacter sp.]